MHKQSNMRRVFFFTYYFNDGRTPVPRHVKFSLGVVEIRKERIRIVQHCKIIYMAGYVTEVKFYNVWECGTNWVNQEKHLLIELDNRSPIQCSMEHTASWVWTVVLWVEAQYLEPTFLSLNTSHGGNLHILVPSSVD